MKTNVATGISCSLHPSFRNNDVIKFFKTSSFILFIIHVRKSPTCRQRSLYLSDKTRKRERERERLDYLNASYLNLKSEKWTCFIARCRKDRDSITFYLIFLSDPKTQVKSSSCRRPTTAEKM